MKLESQVSETNKDGIENWKMDCRITNLSEKEIQKETGKFTQNNRGVCSIGLLLWHVWV